MSERAKSIYAHALPLLGIIGGIVSVFYPVGYKAFCLGMQGVTV